jgi:hypothetical protein
MDRMPLPARGLAVRELDLPLPPARMPRWQGRRPLKSWRYVGVFGPELQICVGDARIGPVPVRWWAIAEPGGSLREGSRGVSLRTGCAEVADGEVAMTITLDEREPVETATSYGDTFAWTAKQADVPARGVVKLDGREIAIDARAVVDVSAGYHPRHTAWKWSAGVGRLDDGRSVGWNLVTGIHDSVQDSERTIWVDGVAEEAPPVEFAADLSAIRSPDGELSFEEWAARQDRTNALLMRSYYRQPFGTFAGTLPGGLLLSEGYGVREEHEVWG